MNECSDICLSNLPAGLRSSAIDFITLNKEITTLDQNVSYYWYAMGHRLQKIKSNRLYYSGSYQSFTDYCKRGLGINRSQAYRLIQTVRFIDKQCQQATEDQIDYCRVTALFKLGFTKLYLLSRLPEPKLYKLFREGIAISINHFYPQRRISLKQASTNQLKQALYLPKRERTIASTKLNLRQEIY